MSFLVLGAKNEIGRFLCLRRHLDNEGLVVLQLLKPAVDVSGRVFNRAFSNPSLTAKERSAHFGDQFLPAIRAGAKTRLVGKRGAIQA